MLLCWLSIAQLVHSLVLYAHSDKQSLPFLYVYYRCIESVSFLNTIYDRFIAMLAILECCTSLKDKKFNSLGFCSGLADSKESTIFYSLYCSWFKAAIFIDQFVQLVSMLMCSSTLVYSSFSRFFKDLKYFIHLVWSKLNPFRKMKN